MNISDGPVSIITKVSFHEHEFFFFYSRDKHIVGNVVQVTSVLEPGASHADMVGGALAVNLEQEQSIFNVLPIPLGKWSEKL